MPKYVKILGVVGGVLTAIYTYLQGDSVQAFGLLSASLGSASVLSK